MANGNGWLIKTLVGFGVTVIVGTQTFAGNAIYKNRETNVKEHIEIKETMINRDESFMESLHKFDVRQEVLIQTVDRIERKL